MPSSIPFHLDQPGTYIYDGAMATRGYNINVFALSLKRPSNRERFLADESAYLAHYALNAEDRGLILKRDWTGLLKRGCHLLALLKLAATVGESLWHIGAHNVGTTVPDLMAACPRRVSGLPGEERKWDV